MTCVPDLLVHLGMIARNHHHSILWYPPVLKLQVFTVWSTEYIPGNSYAKRFGIDGLQQGLTAELGKVELDAPSSFRGVYSAVFNNGSNTGEK